MSDANSPGKSVIVVVGAGSIGQAIARRVSAEAASRQAVGGAPNFVLGPVTRQACVPSPIASRCRPRRGRR